MTTSQTVGHPGVQVSFPNEKDHRRQIAQLANRLNQGQMNCTLIVTLDPDVTQTTVTDSRISSQTCVIFSPQTADAAAAIPTTSAVCTNGALVISHASSAETDRTFNLGLIG